MSANKVLVYKCQKYDSDLLKNILNDAIKKLKIQIKGNVFVKPSCEFAFYNDKILPNESYVHLSVLDSTLKTLSNSESVSKITVGEKAGFGFPSRIFLRWANYYNLVDNLKAEGFNKPVTCISVEEDWTEDVFIGGKVHSYIQLPSTYVESDFKVHLNKLRADGESGFRGCITSNSGLLSNDELDLHHDYLYNEKLIDLYEAVQPNLVVLDAVNIGTGHPLFSVPLQLGLIVIGTNQLAVDCFAAHIIGEKNLKKIDYYNEALIRGFGPASSKDLEIDGDFNSINDLKEYTKKIDRKSESWSEWHNSVKELEKRESPIKIYHGTYDKPKGTHCNHGCRENLDTCLAMIEKTNIGSLKKVSPTTIIIGKHNKPIDCKNSNVLLIGKCAEAKIENARRIFSIKLCYATVLAILFKLTYILRVKNPLLKPRFVLSVITWSTIAVILKTINLKYIRGIYEFIKVKLFKII